MLKKIISGISGLAIIAWMITLPGCYKTITVVENPGATDTTTISFSENIQPIFSASCALSGCHVAGKQVPDLSSGVAYQSLQDGDYVMPFQPDNSELYQWLTGKLQPAMPLGTGPVDSINVKIYAWINQGAKNN